MTISLPNHHFKFLKAKEKVVLHLATASKLLPKSAVSQHSINNLGKPALEKGHVASTLAKEGFYFALQYLKQPNPSLGHTE
ncbi:MAG: hypothetical protein CMM01_24735 [Rhodopirellula sp.]|nr:hypothetical protein [Rhodopirellula sp.]